MVLSGGPRVGFLTRYDGEVSEPLVGRQGRIQGAKCPFDLQFLTWDFS